MFRWSPYAFVRFTAALSLGILCYVNGFWPHNNTLAIWFLLLGFYAASWILSKKYAPQLANWSSTILGIVGLACIAWGGGLLAEERTEAHNPSHLLHLPDSVSGYKAIIISDVQQGAKSQRATVQLQAVRTIKGWKNTEGKILLTFQKDTTKKEHVALKYGDILLVGGAPDTIARNRNPHEFNFSEYLARQQQVYHQQYIRANSFRVLSHDAPNPFVAWSYKVSHFCDAIFQEFIPSKREYGISSALILGIKDGLDNEIKNAYSAAGAMHILAVSGMHVALVYELFVLTFGFLKKRKPYGAWTFALVVLVFLWFYALITGWSASVLRAVTMFSFIVLADASGRKTNIYNTLAVSAFVLMCYNPFLLFDVGFLLSYIAVAGIVYVHPMLYQAATFNNKIVDYIWNISCVSVAAQLATFPMSLYYFHQFPNYFLLSNLFLIPISTIAMYAGIAMLMLHFIPGVNVLVSWILYGSIWLLNGAVLVTEQLPMAITQGIDVSLLENLLIYAIIALGLLFFVEKRLIYWIGVCCLLVIFSLLQIKEDVQQSMQQRLAVYYVPKQSVLCFTEGKTQYLVCSDSLLNDEATKRFRLYADWYDMGTEKVQFVSVPSPLASQNIGIPAREFSHGAILRWQNKNVMLLNKKIGYGQRMNIPSNIQYLVIQKNTLQTLKSLSNLPPSIQLIIDTSNKQYLSKKLAKEAADLKLTCHNIWTQGAFIFNPENIKSVTMY